VCPCKQIRRRAFPCAVCKPDGKRKTRTRYGAGLLLTLLACLAAGPAAAKTTVLDSRLHHLRSEGEREWSDFPMQPEGPRLVLRFQAERNEDECALRLRQQDVKQTWKVLLNGKELGRLAPD